VGDRGPVSARCGAISSGRRRKPVKSDDDKLTEDEEPDEDVREPGPVLQSPAERFAATLTLSDLALAFFRGNPDAPVLDRLEDLEEKARLWAAPLKVIQR